MEILSGLFCSMSANQNFKFRWRCKKDRISHLCFADDLMIFSKGDVHSIGAHSVSAIMKITTTCSLNAPLRKHYGGMSSKKGGGARHKKDNRMEQDCLVETHLELVQ